MLPWHGKVNFRFFSPTTFVILIRKKPKKNSFHFFISSEVWAAVTKVCYPGLETHPGHEIARRQMRGFGGMLSFELAGHIDPLAYLRRLEMVNCAVSLGGVESTICQPLATSHQKVPEQERLRLGITPGLLRLSTGIEDAGEIAADLLQALT